MKLFKSIHQKCPCFFYPIKIGVGINPNQLKKQALPIFLGDKRSIKINF